MDQKRPELDFDDCSNEISGWVFFMYCVLMALVANIMQKMDERIGIVIRTVHTAVLGENLSHCHFVHHLKSHFYCPGMTCMNISNF